MTLATALEPKFNPVEFGDFQTPPWLAQQIVELVGRDTTFKAVLEPTCGIGNFLSAAVDALDGLEVAVGLEINPQYVQFSRERAWPGLVPDIRLANIFETNFNSITRALPTPFLFLGNPPWITSAGQGSIEGKNLPHKFNGNDLTGLDALTGKSNFDVSEWILIKILEQISGTENACAMIIKSSVARKIILYASRKKMKVHDFKLYSIDAKKAFNVSVDACVLFFRGTPRVDESCFDYCEFPSLESQESISYFLKGEHFICNLEAFSRTQKYAVTHPKASGQQVWRSGVKHDLARVMELRYLGKQLVNGDGNLVDVEPDLLYPLFKSSDVAKGLVKSRLYTLITQHAIGASTENIAREQPKTWAYLVQHASLFNERKSSIYREKPPFSIFGIGSYSFAPYKVAISGLYKRLKFTLLEPIDGKCVMVDDTCYFIGFDDLLSAQIYCIALEHPESQKYFEVRIEWSDKRPIKKDILDSFNLQNFINSFKETLKKQVLVSGQFSTREVEEWFAQFGTTPKNIQPSLLEMI